MGGNARAGEHNRRSVYLIAKRNLRLPFMEVFDAPDAADQLPAPRIEHACPQALELMNGDLATDWPASGETRCNAKRVRRR